MVKKIIKIMIYLILLSIVLWAIGKVMYEPEKQQIDISNIAIKQR